MPAHIDAMRLVAPVCAPDEVEALGAAGADELYCGLLEQRWASKYGSHDSISRRQGRANLSSREELEAVVTRAAAQGMPVHLALNSRYTEPQLDYLAALCLEFEQMGGAGLQLFDLGLLHRLHGRTGLKLCLSIMAVADNTATLRTYSRLGVSRAVLPRFTTAKEAAVLLGAVPELEGEVMAFFDRCHFVDGYCRYYHGEAFQDASPAQIAGCPRGRAIWRFDTTFAMHGCHGLGLAGVAEPCAACHLGAFAQSGVGFAKLGGRGLPLERRLDALSLLHAAASCKSDDERRRAYSSYIGHPCTPAHCYYGDFRQHRSRIEPRAIPKQGRSYVGSETDADALPALLAQLPALLDGSSPLTILLAPLPQSLFCLLERLCVILAAAPAHLDLHVCLNDLGSYCRMAEMRRDCLLPGGCQLTVGRLLAREDCDPVLAGFLSGEGQGARTVMADGRVCELGYCPPSPELARHWAAPSLSQPSAQAALKLLTGMDGATLEFG
jgi:putative protease